MIESEKLKTRLGRTKLGDPPHKYLGRMSASMELVDVSRVYWKEIAKKCNKAVVFVENAAAERYLFYF